MATLLLRAAAVGSSSSQTKGKTILLSTQADAWHPSKWQSHSGARGSSTHLHVHSLLNTKSHLSKNKRHQNSHGKIQENGGEGYCGWGTHLDNTE